MNKYVEPKLSILVLDFRKEEETLKCLNSIKKHVKFGHKVIYLHNGPENSYTQDLLRLGLVDHFIQTRNNNGLGIGTRDLFAACFSEYSLYLQNDQFFIEDFDEQHFDYLTNNLNQPTLDGKTIKSISLAGYPCGKHIYSERAHLIRTQDYREWELKALLSCHGAGPYHNGPWREENIQKIYKENNYVHLAVFPFLVADNGKRAVRQNPDGSIWEHFPDTKQLKLIKGPVLEKYVYPKFTDDEWEGVLKTQQWTEWQIPEKEKGESFHVWN